jgi:hypothetical protein
MGHGSWYHEKNLIDGSRGAAAPLAMTHPSMKKNGIFLSLFENFERRTKKNKMFP